MASSTTTTQLPEAHAPHAKHDLAFHDTHHVGLDEVKALVHAQGAHIAPERIAELMVQHPSDAHAIHDFVHKTLGNGFMQHVTKAMPNAKQANHVDIGMNHLNEHDRGSGTTGADPNRLALHGVEAKLETDTPVYSNDGKAFEGHAKAGRSVELNTGAAKPMTLEGHPHPVPCVLGFRVQSGAHAVTGWIPVSALDATGQKLAGVDKKIAGEVADKHADVRFAHHAHKVKPKDPPAAFEDLRLAASTAKSHDTANLPEHYYARGSVVNLLSNVPNTAPNAEKKFGVALDVLVEGTEFFEASPQLVDHVQLWEKKSNKLTNEVITFVYGKAVHGHNTSYGWINKDCLG